jgi:tetratricopeptide (TPR) repeat protein
VAAARQSGATELVDGALYDLAPGQMRLDLRRVDLASGAVLEAYTVEGGNLFLLADSGTARLLRDLGGAPLAGSLADVSTRSVRAYQLYEAGLRLYYEGERPEAERQFQAALKEDSAFAMAQFYYAMSTAPGLRTESVARLRRAVQLARNASDRERLLVNATWAFSNTSPSLRAIAETLMVRYPAELEGYLMAGQAAILAGDYDAAHGPLEAVIARDSLGLRGSTPRCLACEAMPALSTSYVQEDSMATAVAVARRWTRLQPGSGVAWRMLAMLLAQSGRFPAADSALARSDSLLPRDPKSWRYHAASQLWRWDFVTAGEMARGQLHAADPDERVEASWVLALVLRQQGRLGEALVAARRYRATRGEQGRAGAAPSTALLEGQVLFEQGAYQAAAALCDSIARGRVSGEDSSAVSRGRVWSLTHAAGVLAAQGDTARLAGLADTIRLLGRQSAYARDQHLHFYVQGLLALARGRNEEAVQLFRTSIISPNVGYTRANLLLGRTLTRVGRPREAVTVLQSALRGMFEGSNLYVTHTDLSEALAEAFEAAGERDSAAYHYQRLVKAWEGVDPRFTPRIANARGRAMLMLERRSSRRNGPP